MSEAMPDWAKLVDLIEPHAAALGFALVRVRLFGQDSGNRGDERTLQVMAERPDTRQLTIDDCAALSRRISDTFDELEEQGKDPIEGGYRLEVSSPGIDRPLTRFQDYADWIGHEARITLLDKRDGQKQFRGELMGTDPDGETVLIAARGGDARLPFVAIADAKLVLTDKLIAATQPLSVEGAEEEELEAEEQD